jgi:hypothetical protein
MQYHCMLHKLHPMLDQVLPIYPIFRNLMKSPDPKNTMSCMFPFQPILCFPSAWVEILSCQELLYSPPSLFLH